MGLPKGKTNNPNGRPQGSKNKVGAEFRERVIAFVEQRWEQLEADFDQLEPRERIIFIEKLLPYAIPKLQAVSVDMGSNEGLPDPITIFKIPDNGRVPDYRSMTDEELYRRLAMLKSKTSEGK